MRKMSYWVLEFLFEVVSVLRLKFNRSGAEAQSFWDCRFLCVLLLPRSFTCVAYAVITNEHNKYFLLLEVYS